MNNIIVFIPVGRENAVTRAQLNILTGLGDRVIRDQIHEARRFVPIINIGDGKGYYIPDPLDPVERAELNKYVRQEESRIKSIGWALKAARKALR